MDGVEYALTVKTLKSSVAVKLALRAAGSINLDIPGSSTVITATTKNFQTAAAQFVLKEIVIAKTTTVVTDKFTVEQDENKFTLTAASGLQAGNYTAKIAADCGNGTIVEKTVNFAVKQPAKTAAVSVALKSSGMIDVIRPTSTKVTLTPTFKNCFVYELDASKVVITRTYDAASKTKVSEDWTDRFDITVVGSSFEISLKPGAKVSHADKFTVKEFRINGSETFTNSKSVKLNVKQGKASVAISKKIATLFKKDRFSYDTVTIKLTDSALIGIREVRFVSPKAGDTEIFTLRELGSGEYAIAFNGNRLAAKGGTVKLQVFLEGNETGKANITFNVKVKMR